MSSNVPTFSPMPSSISLNALAIRRNPGSSATRHRRYALENAIDAHSVLSAEDELPHGKGSDSSVPALGVGGRRLEKFGR